jgi:hypothetical protein
MDLNDFIYGPGLNSSINEVLNRINMVTPVTDLINDVKNWNLVSINEVSVPCETNNIINFIDLFKSNSYISYYSSFLPINSTKSNIFVNFIDLFKSNSSTNYYPSCFTPVYFYIPNVLKSSILVDIEVSSTTYLNIFNIIIGDRLINCSIDIDYLHNYSTILEGRIKGLEHQNKELFNICKEYFDTIRVVVDEAHEMFGKNNNTQNYNEHINIKDKITFIDQYGNLIRI